jgi:hypothetical protein
MRKLTLLFSTLLVVAAAFGPSVFQSNSWAGPVATNVSVDVKPGSCPNPFQVKNGGVVSVAVVGTETFNVSTVNPYSVHLYTDNNNVLGPATNSTFGIQPVHMAYEDVTTPTRAGGCTTAGPDGIVDLVLKFASAELSHLVACPQYGEPYVNTTTYVSGYWQPSYPVGTVVTFNGSVPFDGVDTLQVQCKGQSQPVDW